MNDLRIPLPTASAMKRPILDCLAARGGTVRNETIRDDVARALGLTAAQLVAPHDPDRGRRSELEYRLAWARSQLSTAGMIKRTGRGTWSLTDAGHQELASARQVEER